MSMRPIRLPEPPSAASISVPEIFDGAVNVIRRAVIIGNGFPGAENQSLGLVRALGLANHYSIHRVIRPRGGVNEWLRWLPVSLHNLIQHISTNSTLRPRAGIGLSSILHADATTIATIARESFEKEGPLLIVASGRDTISLASSIKRLAPENVFVIQIQHPRIQLERFDLVVTPKHDYYALTPNGQQEIPRILRRWITPQEPPSKNVILTVGALHQADLASLRIAAATWHDELAPLPKPLLVVNIGGPTRNCKYGADLAIELVGSLHNVLPSCGSVRISFSRRTPQMVSEIIIRELGDNPKIYIWDNEGPNPHMGHLAWGDAFVITADSISMLSEACSTGKPVYVIGSERCKWKFLSFHRTLRERGVVRPFTGLEDISNSWSYPPLNDAAEAAARVRAVLAERGWSIGH